MGIAENVRKASLEKSTENLPKGENTEKLQTQIATGATGKAQSAGQNLKQSNIAEQIGMVNARGAQQQVAVDGLDKASDIAAKEATMEVQQKEVAAANRVKEMEHETQQADEMDKVLSKIEHSEKSLDDREDALQLEEMASNLRLSDKKYTHELETIGKRYRIDNKAAIDKEAARLEIGNATQRLYEDISAKKSLNAVKRKDQEAEMMANLDNAFKIADAKIADDLKASKIGFATSMVQTGVSAYQAGAFDTPEVDNSVSVQQNMTNNATQSTSSMGESEYVRNNESIIANNPDGSLDSFLGGDGSFTPSETAAPAEYTGGPLRNEFEI